MNLKDITDISLHVSDTLSYDLSFSDDIKIDRTDLANEFEDQPCRFAKYASLCAIMQKKLLDIKREVKELYARTDARVREAAKQAGTKLTETMVENCVVSDPDYVIKQKKESEISLMVDLLSGFKEAFKQRKDMLQQLGADNRQSTFDTRVYTDVHKDR